MALNTLKKALSLFKKEPSHAFSLAWAYMWHEKQQKIPPKSKNKRILYIVYEQANIKLGLQLAQHGQETGQFDVILWSPRFQRNSFQHIKNARKQGACFIYEMPRKHKILAQRDSMNEIYETPLKQTIWSALNESQKNAVFKEISLAENKIHKRAEILNSIKCDAIVLPEDNIEQDSFAWTRVAKVKQIPTSVVSYGTVTDAEWYNAYKNSAAHRLPENLKALFKTHFSEWLWPLNDERTEFMTRIPYEKALARVVMGFEFINPYVVNSGDADIICVESKRQKDVYSKYKFPDKKLSITGHPIPDSMYPIIQEKELKKKDLYKQYHFASDKELVVIAIPPCQDGLLREMGLSYKDIVASYVETAQERLNANILLSIHPATSAYHRKDIEYFGVPIDDQGAASVIPLCDLYIACISTTIRWALSCGIPVINYDCYQYAYDDYTNLPQVMECSTRSEFEQCLVKWSDQTHKNKMLQEAQSQSEYWGVIDGRAMQCIVQDVFKERS